MTYKHPRYTTDAGADTSAQDYIADQQSSFADATLIEAMAKLGFQLSHHEGIADWFVKDEGTSQMTVYGARDLVERIATLKGPLTHGYDIADVPATKCLMCLQPIGERQWREVRILARFGQMLFEHVECPE